MSTWDLNNLKRHYEKHPLTQCKACWAKLLGQSAPISITDYEQTSINVLRTAWLSFIADSESEDRHGPAIHKCKYGADDHLFVTIEIIDIAKIKTSYRFHEKQETHSTNKDLQDRLALILKFGRQKLYAKDRISNITDVNFLPNNNSSHNERKQYNNALNLLSWTRG
jgi:hypothetical protein